MRNLGILRSTMMITKISGKSASEALYIISWSRNPIASRSSHHDLEILLLVDFCLASITVWKRHYDGRPMLDAFVLRISSIVDTWGKTKLEDLTEFFGVINGVTDSVSGAFDKDLTLERGWSTCGISQELGENFHSRCHWSVLKLELVYVDGEESWIDGVDLRYGGVGLTCKVTQVKLEFKMNVVKIEIKKYLEYYIW